MSDTQTSRPALPIIPFLLTCVLIALKITGHLAISWWIVFLPMYLGLAVGLLLMLALAAGTLIFMIGAMVWAGITEVIFLPEVVQEHPYRIPMKDTIESIDTALHELRDLWIAERDYKKKRALYAQINVLLDKRLVVMGVPSIP